MRLSEEQLAHMDGQAKYQRMRGYKDFADDLSSLVSEVRALRSLEAATRVAFAARSTALGYGSDSSRCLCGCDEQMNAVVRSLSALDALGEVGK